METYKKSILEYDDVLSAVNLAHEEGHEEGLKKGLKKGLQITAVNCLKRGMSIDDVCEITGLSKEDILSFKS